MAQVNLTLSHEEILQLLQGTNSDAFRELLQATLNQFILAESTEQIKAEPYERSDERTDHRNGSREKPLTTRIGTITLTVPRHRNEPFQTMLFDNYQRSEAALISTMAEMVISGVSTRKVSNVMETLCGQTFSKSTVSEACRHLDEEVEKFRSRPIEAGKYPFIMMDATYFKCRDDRRIRSRAFMVAVGISSQGGREVLGFNQYEDESNPTWTSFVKSLKDRGLSGVIMYTSDAHPSIRHAMSQVFPDAVWQRCQFHFLRNILDEAPKKLRAGLETELREMFNCRTIGEARKCRDEILKDYSDVAEKSMEILDNGFEDSMPVMMLPEELRRPLRTSNILERLNGELKRRSNVIRVFPNPESILRLMGSVTIDYNDMLLSKRRLFYSPTMARVTEETRLIMMKLAHEQAQKEQAA